MTIGIIILAAGSSSRLGQSKQLIQLNGKSLLQHAANVALNSEADIVITMVGSNAQLHKSEIESLNVEIIENKGWQLGMGNSLKVGLNHLLTSKTNIQAAIIMVCDQPYLTASHLNALINTYKKEKPEIVASTYNLIKGVPALFAASLFPKLLKLGDTEGARKIIEKHVGSIVLVPFEKGEIDIDTPEDLERLG